MCTTVQGVSIDARYESMFKNCHFFDYNTHDNVDHNANIRS